MAARQQQKGIGFGIQYEDIVPKSEWQDQPEATLITIDLPDFGKEEIKVTYVHTSRLIRVTGERPVASRRWIRFNEVFTVPQNCLVDKIHGSFKNNVLTITLPKETVTKMPNLPEASNSVAENAEKLEEKRLLEESRRKEKEEEAEKTKKLLEEKEELIRKLQEEAIAKQKAEARKIQEEAIAKQKAEARKLQEETIVKEKAEARKLQEEAIAKQKAEEKKLQEEAIAKEKAHARKLHEEAIAKQKAEARKLQEEATLEKKLLKAEERKLPEVDYTKLGPVSVTKLVPGGLSDAVKSAEEKVGYLIKKEKKIGKGIMEKIRRKQITSEDKKLMMNVGVAALVIFALGAYVSYTFCSSSSSSSSSPSSSSSTKPE
ncbi:unnamed protein product [Cochlearia groenlandica]